MDAILFNAGTEHGETMNYPHFKPSEALHKELKTLRSGSHVKIRGYPAVISNEIL